MTGNGVKILLLAAMVLFLCVPVLNAQGAPGVTLTAPTNITLPSQGDLPLPTYAYQMQSVNNYAGNVSPECNLLNGNSQVIAPICILDSGLAEAIPLSAGQTYTGSMKFQEFAPVTVRNTHPAKGMILTLAGLLFVGLGLRRRARKLGLLVLCVAAGIAAASMGGCSGGNKVIFTPGTYVYEIVITGVASNTQLATSKLTLVVPKGE